MRAVDCCCAVAAEEWGRRQAGEDRRSKLAVRVVGDGRAGSGGVERLCVRSPSALYLHKWTTLYTSSAMRLCCACFALPV